jgi:hypothetical protein
MRSVNWPTKGDAATFRRRAAILIGIGACTIAATLGATALYDAALVPALLPLGGSCLLLTALWAHGSARTAGRRSEVARSFAGLAVVHHGSAFEVAAEHPVVGEYATRRLAARAALDRGTWAIIVHAWDRYYVLSCEPAAQRHADEPARPVAFRSRAVADVVPALLDDVVA